MRTMALQGYSRSSQLKRPGLAWMAVSTLMLLGSNTVESNTLIESFAIPRNQIDALQMHGGRFLLIKQPDSTEALSKNSWDDKGGSDLRSRMREVVEEYSHGYEEDLEQSAKREPSSESTAIVSIKPNRLTRLRLNLNRNPLPQKFSYLFLLSQDERLRGSSGRETKTHEKLFDPFSNWINRSVTTLLRLVGRPMLDDQRFSVRFSWDASDHVGLHLDLDPSPSPLSDLMANDTLTPAFFNLTITPNFDKFSDHHSAQTDSFVDLVVIVEPLLLNLLPMFTLLPLFSTCVCILSVIYIANVPARFENFLKSSVA
ncbi:hypothetical protein PTTG_11969 [Puccinia triticina 1-1 BBBD Race 1]|uniref:Uncharacterized protein n=2 Tax=Puccinia triticina (isolate 1-1 / race 1 (BBBD)) TaxID=630390 RepID=A0A180GJL7_PUCT1|nr:hypothetical protein PTTG_11969 [Puccinia triticina 1-1 BBBD Race 1]